MRSRTLTIVLLLFVCCFASLFAQVPRLINYQGMLTDPNTGERLSGAYSISFSIYSVATGGTALWTESQSVIAHNGLFNVLLGNVSPITPDLFDGNDRYLGVTVGSDAEMTPRKQLVSVGYAMKAFNSDKFAGKDTSDFVRTGQENSIGTAMLQDDAVSAAKISPNIISSIDGVSNDGGNVDLEAGDNVTITPDDANNKITISAAAGTGDNLGNHTATQNIQLNHNWLSGDGDDEGIYVSNTNANVGVGKNNPTEKLDVAGVVRSSTGGFKFPDGTVQSTAATSSGPAWSLAGNSGTNETDNFVGTTDNIGLNFRINNMRALKLEPNNISPCFIGGFVENQVKSGVRGAVIGGGGKSGEKNYVTDHFGTVGGGSDNQAGDDDSDRTNREYATVGGGKGNNAEAEYSTIGGGVSNTVSGAYSTVGGGIVNSVSGEYATVPGGDRNVATGNNSFAAGTWAHANHNGSFVWGDNHATNFESTGENQFLVRANGGVGINKNDPDAALDVNGDIKFGQSGEYFAVGGIEELRIIRGTIDRNGAIVSGSGFTIDHQASGEYLIVFDDPFAARPSGSVTQVFPNLDNFGSGGYTLDNALFTGISTTQAKVITGNHIGDKSDRCFTFFIIGPR